MAEDLKRTEVSDSPSPEAHHRRQAAWQIWLPLGLILATFLFAGAMIVLYTVGYLPETGLPDQQSPLAKSSAILLISGACLGSLLQLFFLVGMVLLTAKIIKNLPGIAHRVQAALRQTALLVKYYGDKLATPVITVSGGKAAANQLLKSLKLRGTKPETK